MSLENQKTKTNESLSNEVSRPMDSGQIISKGQPTTPPPNFDFNQIVDLGDPSTPPPGGSHAQ